MSVMFASNRAQGGAAGAGHLIEFKAGRTNIEPGSTPELRKAVARKDPGLVFIKHSQDDQLLHLYWQNRDSKETPLDLIIFPGETEFKQITECKDGRVFMLKFKTSDERHLFWMQEAVDEKKDEEICKKMNDLLSNPPPPSRPATGRGAASGAGANRFAALSNAFGGNMDDIGALGNLDQNQLMRLFSLMNGSAGAGAAELANLSQIASAGGGNKTEGGSGAAGQTPASAGGGPISALLRRGGQGGGSATANKKDGASAASGGSGSIGGGSATGGGGGITPQLLDQFIKAATSAKAASDQQRVELSAVLTRNKTQEVVQKHGDALKPHLPDQKPLQEVDAELRQTVGNPQFQQAADFFGHALQMGQLGDAFLQFGLNAGVVEAAKKGDLRDFAAKLTAQEAETEADKQIAADAKASEKEGTAAAGADAEEKAKKEAAEEKAKKRKKEVEEGEGKGKRRDGDGEDDGMDLD